MLGPLVAGLNLIAIIRMVTSSSQMPGWAMAISVAIPLLNVAFVCRFIVSSFLESLSDSEIISIFLRSWPVIMMVINGIFLLLILVAQLSFMAQFGLLGILTAVVISLTSWTVVLSFYYAYNAIGQES